MAKDIERGEPQPENEKALVGKIVHYGDFKSYLEAVEKPVEIKIGKKHGPVTVKGKVISSREVSESNIDSTEKVHIPKVIEKPEESPKLCSGDWLFNMELPRFNETQYTSKTKKLPNE